MTKETFKQYDEIIKNHKYDMTLLHIYYILTLSDDFLTLNDEEIKTLIECIHNAYMKDENYTDLAHICDVAIENKEKILKNDFSFNEFTPQSLLSLC